MNQFMFLIQITGLKPKVHFPCTHSSPAQGQSECHNFCHPLMDISPWSTYSFDFRIQKQRSTTAGSAHASVTSTECTFNGLCAQCTKYTWAFNVHYYFRKKYFFSGEITLSGVLPLTETCAVASIIPRDEIATQV